MSFRGPPPSVLEAILSDIMGDPVRISSPGNEVIGPPLSMEQVFNSSYSYSSEFSGSFAIESFSIFVRLPSGKLICMYVDTTNTIGDIKQRIADKHSVGDVRLRLHTKELHDTQTVASAGLQSDCSLELLPRLRGGGAIHQTRENYCISEPDQVFSFAKEQGAPRYDYDFTNMVDDGKTYMRGGYKYHRPYGWYRHALNVVGRYSDDRWLGPNGIRTESAEGEWPVAYHGTKQPGNVGLIVADGFKSGPRQLYEDEYGPRIYTSPSLTMVSDVYAKVVDVSNDGKYKYVMQTRVDPESLKIVPNAKNGADYWLSPEDPKEFSVRPYGILIQKISAATTGSDGSNPTPPSSFVDKLRALFKFY